MATAHYVLVANSAYTEQGECISGFELAMARLEYRLWPFYRQTPNRRTIKAGDRCLAYVAGNGLHAQHFIASATLDDVRGWPKPFEQFNGNPIMGKRPVSALSFSTVVYFTDPVNIRPMLRSLELTHRNPTRWGLTMQRGCRAISETDFDKINKQAVRKRL